VRIFNFILVALFVGCAFGTQSIEEVDPGSIPPNPTYSKDVAPIINYYCLSCHDASGPFFEEPSLGSLGEVKDEYEGIVEEVFGKRSMPPGGAQQLNSREAQILQLWAQQGFLP
jgi:hypothetical protein